MVDLCAEEGFVHVIAYMHVQNNFFFCNDYLDSDDLTKHRSTSEHFIRSEISTLIGCMCKAPINWTLPPPQKFDTMIKRASTLLSEMEEKLESVLYTDFQEQPMIDMTTFGAIHRGAVFYAPDSAYHFQYVDMATQRYVSDTDWLVRNKGYEPKIAQKILRAIVPDQREQITKCLKHTNKGSSNNLSILPGFTLNITRLAAATGISEQQISAFLEAFTYPADAINRDYNHVDDFNEANATPLLKDGSGNYVLLQYASLAEAVYDSPFYWFCEDTSYEDQAMKHRGEFAETFLVGRLEAIFGKDKVHANVNVYCGKNRIGEIDCLVVFGSYALQFQAKSKRLTLSSRQGNIGKIKEDFKSAVQSAYCQASKCARFFGKENTIFEDSRGNKIEVPTIGSLYPICIVSDHYPSLPMQVRQFLRYKTDEILRPPIVCDVFLIDTITEMLSSPLRFLHYIRLRARAVEKVITFSELALFGYYLQWNLWLDNGPDLLMLDNSFSTPLDSAMQVRREGLKGKATPEGILTKLNNTLIGKLISEIEHNPDPPSVSIGLHL
ncbi:MAG: hypothetical protein AAF512_16610, partial [Pseudomonadota bacterium]